jgi:hypothetical protein
MPRFVIQEHQKQGQETHWDLMLEHGEVLKTYRLDIPPKDILTCLALAVPIADHDKRFLTYEGPVNQGLGTVRIVEKGRYSRLLQNDLSWSFFLRGKLLKGPYEITKSHNDSWQFQPMPPSRKME